MSQVTVKVDQELCEAYLQQLPQHVQSAFKAQLRAIAEEAAEIMREEAPERTGRLRQSIEILQGTEDSYLVTPLAPYAVYVEFGTRPHIITPAHASVLRFQTGNGNIVFSMRVSHPGIPPNPFIARTQDRAREIAFETMQEGIVEAVKIEAV